MLPYVFFITVFSVLYIHVNARNLFTYALMYFFFHYKSNNVHSSLNSPHVPLSFVSFFTHSVIDDRIENYNTDEKGSEKFEYPRGGRRNERGIGR